MDYQGKAVFCKNTKCVRLFHFADIGTKEATVGETASVTAGAPTVLVVTVFLKATHS